MATGDEDDMLRRQQSVLPRGWFADTAETLIAVLAGFASAASGVYGLLSYARLQTRIKTATAGWLDLIAYDFFGLRFKRRGGEQDRPFADRIIAEVLRPRATRQSIIDVLTDLTGTPPYMVLEPANPRDTGGYGLSGAMGYSMHGRYGSLMLPQQMFVIPLRPPGQGIPGVQGYREFAGDRAIGGLGAGAIKYGELAEVSGPVTDADIYAAIESVRPAGTIVWVSSFTSPPEAFLDDNAYLDSSLLS